ncbi:MAG: nuclear transport factor 2 family protein [Candidatus Dormibacteraeota bacterium]|uniref:Nuclear transport factor 2 family protein n=1 Tax=Candidatus Amunia macphersoniae TaxID=3127014 RepID=A0A934NFG7_9BACT|nr:nuclear transport factor 2 family protein [Candidatus Dormibacteraeota bacterium]
MVEQAEEMVNRLLDATNAHDIDALVGCFAEDYVNETPAHPARSFRGRAQVRRNWEQIFGFVPDLRATISRRCLDGATLWTEWEMTGTRRDGTPHRMRGVIIFGVQDGLAGWTRFYLEAVEETSGTADDAVRAQVVRS